MHNARLWFARFVMVYALLIFVFLASLYALDGVSPTQFSHPRDEGLSWLLFVAALLAHPRRA